MVMNACQRWGRVVPCLAWNSEGMARTLTARVEFRVSLPPLLLCHRVGTTRATRFLLVEREAICSSIFKCLGKQICYLDSFLFLQMPMFEGKSKQAAGSSFSLFSWCWSSSLISAESLAAGF